MIWSYLLTAFRNLRKNKLLALINIAGLTLSFVCVFLIAVYCRNECCYDMYNSKAEQIYRVIRTGNEVQEGSCPAFLAESFCSGNPEVFEKASRLWHYWGLGFNVRYEEITFNEENLFYADPSFMEIFDLEFMEGNPKAALSAPGQVIISESTAAVYFGNEGAIDKSLTVNNSYVLTVSGVFRDFPRQSHLHPDFIASFSTLEAMPWKQDIENPHENFCYLYLLAGTDDKSRLEAGFRQILENHFSVEQLERADFRLQPLKDIHFYGQLDDEIERSGNLKTMHVLLLTGIFLMLVASINYINLSLAIHRQRTWSNNLRRIMGAKRSYIFCQFLAESFIVCTLALLASLAALELILPQLSRLAEVFQNYNSFWNFQTILLFLAGGYLVSLIINIQPALAVSAVKLSETPARFRCCSRESGWKKILVIIQLTIATVLIISSIIFSRQISFIENYNVNYDKDNIYIFPVNNTPLAGENYQQFLNALKAEPETVSATGMRSIAGIDHIKEAFSTNVTSAGEMLPFYLVRDDFVKTLDLRITAGRDFLPEFKTDIDESILINENYARQQGWDNREAIGKNIYHQGWGKLKIIGVIADFNFESLHEQAKPLIIKQIWESRQASLTDYIAVRLIPGANNGIFTRINEIWNNYAPESAFEFFSLKMKLNEFYYSDMTISKISEIFSIIAIITANLGFLGILLWLNNRRKKEISIRRALGASVSNIISLLSGSHFRLVMISFFLGVPLAIYFVEKWLAHYAYRVRISWDIFLLSGVILFGLTLLTICVQSIITANNNPVKTLKYE
ncbi:MAG: ABC transporter permease [Candidatus Cloacimonetes bacterium]|nr:ABC transporter permease [Candidatus Cloacimonadota bacterium]